MEADQLTSTGEAARKRREMRRRKILENSDNRMKRLMGSNESNPESPTLSGEPPLTDGMWRDSRQDGMVYQNQNMLDTKQGMNPRVPDARGTHLAPVESHFLRPGSEEHYTQDYYSSTPIISRRHAPGTLGYNQNNQDLLSPDLARPPIHAYDQRTLQNNSYNSNYNSSTLPHSGFSSLFSQQPITQQQQLAVNEVSAFNKKRSLICLLLGFLIRIALCFAIGRRLIQSMVYPFLAVEIVFLGYQQAAGMDIAAGMQSGIWVTILMLCGMKKEFLDTYKLIMTIITTAADDFTIYFFAFAIIHAAGKYFV